VLVAVLLVLHACWKCMLKLRDELKDTYVESAFLRFALPEMSSNLTLCLLPEQVSSDPLSSMRGSTCTGAKSSKWRCKTTLPW
jgi:hypothetical protein